MAQVTRTFFALFLVVSAFIAVVPSQGHADKLDGQLAALERLGNDRTHSITWNDIKSWQPLAGRWATAFDAAGNPVAVYDLSFPQLSGRLPLGLIGAKRVTKEEIVSLLGASKNEPETDVERVDEAISTLQAKEAGALEDGSMPEEWWKQVPWNVKGRAMSTVEPTSFNLSEINFERYNSDPKKFHRAMVQFEKTLDEIEEPGFGKDFLRQFDFVKNPEGGYSMSWTPVLQARAGVSRPRKLVDFTNPKWAFTQGLKLEILHQAVAQAASLVPVPIVSALFEAAIDRFFHFHHLLVRTHENMILEALASAEEGSPIFGDLNLPVENRAAATADLVYAEAGLRWSWKWLFKDPMQEWEKERRRDLDFSGRAAKWLGGHGEKLDLLNARFGMIEAGNPKQELLLLSRQKPGKRRGPKAAIHYADSETTYRERVALEVTSASVAFGVHFIPIAGASTLVNEIYKQVVERPVDTTKIWEGRLAAHLEERTRRENQKFDFELSTLDHQRVNPLEVSRPRLEQLIAQRRLLIGLP